MDKEKKRIDRMDSSVAGIDLGERENVATYMAPYGDPSHRNIVKVQPVHEVVDHRHWAYEPCVELQFIWIHYRKINTKELINVWALLPIWMYAFLFSICRRR